MASPVGDGAPVGDAAAEPAVDTAGDAIVSRAMARVGTTLHDKWHLDTLLGIGGTAAVYAATHRNGSRAAVKILNPELAMHPQVRDRFLREGYAANTVGHEGAVKVLDDHEAQDGSLFLVTELLEGEGLEQRRVRLGGRLSEAEVLRLSDQLLDVIAAAHARGIVHRDLKPDNIFLTSAGKLKVLDFGIAALRELSPTSTGTITGGVMGTPAYMSPEQALGLWDHVDHLSDIWAWGATMFHLLSGQVVHDGRTINEQLLKAMSSSPPSLASVAPDVAPAVAEVVDRAISPERERRWPDARSMQEAVRAAYLERFGRPLSTLPGIAAPLVSVEGKSGSMPTFPATALPVERTPSFLTPTILARHRRTALAIAGAIALGIIGTCAHAIVADRSPESAMGGAAMGGATIAHAVDAVPPASLTALPNEPRPLAQELPKAAPMVSTKNAGADASSASSASSARPTRPVAAPTPPKAAATQACTPPYVVDPDTGKRRWKLECL